MQPQTRPNFMKPFNKKKVFIAGLLKPIWVILGFFMKRKVVVGPSPDSILIMDVHLIGDMIMLTPLVSAIHKKFPEARICLVAGPWAKTVFHHFPEIAEFAYIETPWVKYDRPFYRWWNVVKMIRLLRNKKWDLAIDIRGDIRHTLFLRFSGVKRLVSFSFFGADSLIDDIVPFDATLVHLTDYNRRICEFLEAWHSGMKYQPFLRFSSEEYVSVQAYPEFIGLHFGASLPLKRPPITLLQRWLDEIMTSYPDRLMVVFKIAEDPDISLFIQNYLTAKLGDAKVRSWEGNLRDFMIILSKCKHLFCLDSGPGHIASAIGIQTTAVFGPTLPGKSYPIGVKTQIISGRTLDCQQNCDQRRCTNIIDRACMPETILTTSAANSI